MGLEGGRERRQRFLAGNDVDGENDSADQTDYPAKPKRDAEQLAKAESISPLRLFLVDLRRLIGVRLGHWDARRTAQASEKVQNLVRLTTLFMQWTIIVSTMFASK